MPVSPYLPRKQGIEVVYYNFNANGECPRGKSRAMRSKDRAVYRLSPDRESRVPICTEFETGLLIRGMGKI